MRRILFERGCISDMVRSGQKDQEIRNIYIYIYSYLRRCKGIQLCRNNGQSS